MEKEAKRKHSSIIDQGEIGSRELSRRSSEELDRQSNSASLRASRTSTTMKIVETPARSKEKLPINN